jgi:glycosyltransferase involved in cell wall biosynthesis
MDRGAPRLYVVIDDLLVYGAAITRPTGIQRVALGIATSLIREHGAVAVHAGNGALRHTALPSSTNTSVLARLSEPALRVLAAAPRGVQESVRGIARALLSRVSALKAGRAADADAGDWLLIFGAPWIAPGMAHASIKLAAEKNLRIALLVHDLLPSTDPQWFGDVQGIAAKRDMDELIGAADLLFAVSGDVAAQVRARTARPVHTTMPADPLFPRNTTGSALSTRLPGTTPIVITVGTLHPRKGLASLVRIWDTWIKNRDRSTLQMGEVPILVIAGRRHPQDGELFAALTAHPRARERIVLIHDASDDELAALYARARFLVMPSQAEGWGMPIREALVAGKPSIATDAVPAASASPWVRIVPAGSEEEISRAIHDWWEGSEPERLSQEIREKFMPRSWDDVAREIMEQIRS